MPARLSDSEHRNRLARLTAALGRFGLVDQFDLAGLLGRSQLPSLATIERRLNALAEALPVGVPVQFIAQVIASELTGFQGEDDEALTEGDIGLLKSLRPGKASAYRYHRYIFRVLKRVLRPQLVNGALEQPLHSGLKKIDIVFDNAAPDGFFYDLRHTHDIPATWVPFECKNYSADPANPEFDQVAGRLAPTRGMFGAMVCRGIKDQARAMERCNALMHDDHKYIIVLDDSDIESMVTSALGGGGESVNECFNRKLKALLFS